MFPQELSDSGRIVNGNRCNKAEQESRSSRCSSCEMDERVQGTWLKERRLEDCSCHASAAAIARAHQRVCAFSCRIAGKVRGTR